MTKQPIEVITSIERRRRWSRAGRGAFRDRPCGRYPCRPARPLAQGTVPDRGAENGDYEHLGACDCVGSRAGIPARSLGSAGPVIFPPEV